MLSYKEICEKYLLIQYEYDKNLIKARILGITLFEL